jgi:hypothetical protein
MKIREINVYCLLSGEDLISKEAVVLTDSLDSYVSPFRSSPLFPVDPSLSIIPNSSTRYKILFCFPRSPFSTIGRLVAQLNDERVGHLWFSHGLASLVVITELETVISDVKTAIGSELTGFEEWTVEDGFIVDSDIFLKKYEVPDLPIIDISELPSDIRALFDEYYCSIRIAVIRASAYLPYHLRILLGLHSQVLSIIDILLFIYASKKPAAELVEQYDFDLLASDPGRRLQTAKSLVDQVLQIIGGLSYVVTQGYSGVMPIIQHECPIRAFSLLGVGAAFDALTKIYESVSNVFAKHPVPRLIRDSYDSIMLPIPIFKNFAEYNIDGWRKYSGFLDSVLPNIKVDDNDKMFHLSFFSGTRGFRESLYTISAAIQTIATCAMPKWTLVTLTHEYLHAHVRAIMAILHQEPSKSEFTVIYNEFLAITPQNEASTSISLRKRLLFSLLAANESAFLCKQSAKEIREGKGEGEKRSKRFTASKAYILFKDTYREINEYLVHTLDFLYFYDGNVHLYIKLVWLTWATLPEIQERLSHYLLRTLLATSVNVRGDTDIRFDATVKETISIFQIILDEKIYDDEHVIKNALQVLRDPNEISALRLEFNGCVRFVDLANNFLNSLLLHADLKLDDLQVTDAKGDLVFPIAPCEFQDIDIKSPIAFIADQAQKRLNVPVGKTYTETLMESCWELLVVSSADIASQ